MEENSAAARVTDVVLERGEAVPALIGRHEDFLLIAGLGGTACDVGAVTGMVRTSTPLGGAMGAACMIGVGTGAGATGQARPRW